MNHGHQSLPRPSITASPSKKDTSTPVANEVADRDAALAHMLQPLVEQEALLESFVQEANAQRKYEDAKSLRENLKEIRAEVDRILKAGEENGSKTIIRPVIS
jgi:hypothetical protein